MFRNTKEYCTHSVKALEFGAVHALAIAAGFVTGKLLGKEN